MGMGGRIWTVPPTRDRKGPNPKPEIRGPKEDRNPKPEMLLRGFGLRYSAFGIRIWAAGGGWYCPDRPEWGGRSGLFEYARPTMCSRGRTEAGRGSEDKLF